MTEYDNIKDYPKSAEKMIELILEGHDTITCCRPIYDFLREAINALLENARGDTQEIASEKDIFSQDQRGALSHLHFYWLIAAIVNDIIIPLFVLEEIVKGDNKELINELQFSPGNYPFNITKGTKEAWDFIFSYFTFLQIIKKEITFEQVKSFFFTKKNFTRDKFDAYRKSMVEWVERVKSFEGKKSKIWEISYCPDSKKLIIKLVEARKPSDAQFLIWYIREREKSIRCLLRNIASYWEKLRATHNLENVDEPLVQLALGQVMLWPEQSMNDAKFNTTVTRMPTIVDYKNKKLLDSVNQATAEIHKLAKKKQGYGPGNKKQKKYVLSEQQKNLIKKAIPELNMLLNKFYPVKDNEEFEAKAKAFSVDFEVLRPSDMHFVWSAIRDDKGKVDLAKRILQKYIGRITGEEPTQNALREYLIRKL
jgi:hypothetical protein